MTALVRPGFFRRMWQHFLIYSGVALAAASAYLMVAAGNGLRILMEMQAGASRSQLLLDLMLAYACAVLTMWLAYLILYVGTAKHMRYIILPVLTVLGVVVILAGYYFDVIRDVLLGLSETFQRH